MGRPAVPWILSIRPLLEGGEVEVLVSKVGAGRRSLRRTCQVGERLWEEGIVNCGCCCWGWFWGWVFGGCICDGTPSEALLMFSRVEADPRLGYACDASPAEAVSTSRMI